MIKRLPGDDATPNISDVSPFSETRIAFDSYQDTHQTERVQTETGQDLTPIVDQQLSTMSEVMRRVSNPELEALRTQNPFVDIIPFPMRTLFVVAAKTNDTRDVTLPDNCQLIRFSANTNIDFFVSVAGQVQFPIAENLDGNGVLYAPRDQWFYVKGLRNISIGLPVNQSGVGIMCFVQG